MDYSTIQQDPDDPADHSPWSSSPQVPRDRSLGPRSSSEFSSETLAESYNDPVDADGSLAAAGVTSHLRTVSNDPYSPGHDDGGFGSVPPCSDRHEGFGQDSRQLHIDGQPSPAAQEPRALPHRSLDASSNVRSGQTGRANAPQYRLQAKITGLERTGRKDPILRFDVYVRVSLHHIQRTER